MIKTVSALILLSAFSLKPSILLIKHTKLQRYKLLRRNSVTTLIPFYAQRENFESGLGLCEGGSTWSLFLISSQTSCGSLVICNY